MRKILLSLIVLFGFSQVGFGSDGEEIDLLKILNPRNKNPKEFITEKSKNFQKEAKKCMKVQNCDTKYPNKGFNYIKCTQDLKKGKHSASTQENLDKCIKLIAPIYC